MTKTNINSWLDVSTLIEPGLVVWPGDPNIEINRIATADKDGYNLTHLSMSAHTGTHLDAPYHYLNQGQTIDQIDPNRLIGEVHIFDISTNVISERDLSKLDIKQGANVFFRTTNSDINWQRLPFIDGFVHLNESAAQYLVNKKINLVGIDYLSIGHPHHGEEVHKILLKSQVLILEGLMLQKIDGGRYEMICLPMKIKGADGAPVRVLLRKAND